MPRACPNLIARIALVLLSAWPAGLLAETMYKWVDEKGVTHYSESPPDQGNSAKVELKVTPPSGPVTGGGDGWKQREMDSRKQKAEADGKQRMQEAKEAPERASRCRSARAQLDQLLNARRIFKLNDKGEREYVEDENRPKMIDQAQQEVNSSCR